MIPLSPPAQANARKIASAILDDWFRGEPPDAAAALARYPDLLEDKAAVIDLAYEEFCLRYQAGESLDAEAFCSRFPGLEAELRRLIVVVGYLGNRSSILRDESIPVRSWPVPGEKFRSLTLLRELGHGAFSRVYLATEASAGDRPVAVKFSCEPGREAHTLGRLHHDHIVGVLWADRDEATGLHVVCMPWLGSATLLDVLNHAYPGAQGLPPARGAVILEAIRSTVREGDPAPDRPTSGPDLERLSFADAVIRLAESLADALAFLEARRLVHCDLKPENVLLTPSGRPLLLDFNLALSPEALAPRVGGTFQYMAPEQLRACLENGRLSTEQAGKAELFSLAVILYELLTGQHPFGPWPSDRKVDGNDVPWILERQQQGFLPIRSANPAIPRRLAQLLHRCLSFDPGQRPESAAAVAAEFRRCRPVPVKRLVLASIVLLAGTLLVGGGWWVGGERQHQTPDTKHQTPPQEDVRAYREAAKGQMAEGWRRAVRKEPGAREWFVKAEKNYARAIDAAIREGGADRVEWRDRAGRGRARMLLGDWKDAEHHLQEAYARFRLAVAGIPPEPSERLEQARTLACLSYLYAHNAKHALAQEFANRALAAGFRSPGLLNTLGYSYLQSGALEKANPCFTEALRRDPHLLPALRNRCLLAVRLHHRDRIAAHKAGRLPAKAPQWALDDFDRLLHLAKRNPREEPASLYVQAAILYGCAALESRNRREEAVPANRAEQEFREERARGYVESACRLGTDAGWLCRDGILKQALGDWLDAARLGSLRQQQEVPAVNACLVDPLSSALP
jgi:serine/threonine protein kinase/tetratricopeptide (TPR) repeat protein